MWVKTPAGNAPCYRCPDKNGVCKPGCERFQKWHAQRQEELKEYKAKRDKEDIVDNFQSDMIDKSRRKKR